MNEIELKSGTRIKIGKYIIRTHTKNILIRFAIVDKAIVELIIMVENA